MLSITSTAFSIQNEPNGLRELKHRVYLSDELNGYLEEFSGDLEFFGADYHYLRRTFFNDGCAIVPVTVTDICGLELQANLFLNDAEWRPDICTCTVQVVDAGFLSLIDQNMGIKAYVNVPRSKNDVDITSYVTIQNDLEFKSNTAAGTSALNRQGVRVYDAFKMLIGFMTDGLLDFESDLFFPNDVNQDVRIPTLVTADELRNGRADADVIFPYISFEDLYNDMQSLYNLSFHVQDGVFRIEEYSYFQQSQQTITLAAANKIEQKADPKSFYQKVKFGAQSGDTEDFDYYPNITFLGFGTEEYHLGGQCNNRSILDLELTELITDPNTIMAALPIASGGNADFNSKAEDIFIVTFDSSNVSVDYTHPVDSNLRYYNQLMNNFQIALRWGDGIPFPIFLFLGANQNGALSFLNSAYLPSYENFTGQVGFGAYLTFGNETPPNGFDPNNNMSYSTDTFAINQLISPLWVNINYYSNGNTIYTVPVTSIYTVIFSLRLAEINPATAAAISVFNSVSSAIEQWFNFDQTNVSVQNGAYVYSGSATIAANAGDRIAIGLRNGTDILSDSIFQVNDLDFIEKTYDPFNIALIETSIEYPINTLDWKSFLANRHGIINITYNNGQISGHLKDVQRQLETGETEWTIISNFANS